MPERFTGRSPGGGAATQARPPSLGSLSWLVFRDTNRTLGGGLPAMELMRRNAVASGWIDDSDNAVLVAASRLTPGTNVVAYCVGLGWKLRGAAGAAAALAAASIPASVVIALLSAALVEVDRYLVVRALLAVGTLVASALVLYSGWPLLRPHLRSGARPWTALIAAIAVVTLAAGATPVQTLLLAAAAGAVVRR
jgi:chromate transporter